MKRTGVVRQNGNDWRWGKTSGEGQSQTATRVAATALPNPARRVHHFITRYRLTAVAHRIPLTAHPPEPAEKGLFDVFEMRTLELEIGKDRRTLFW